MPFRPVYGHQLLRDRLAAAWHGDRLPASLLFVGRRGVGKQRLALWLGQMLLCERAQVEALPEPCGACQHCRYAERGNHPDLRWFFPRPRLKDGDASADDVRADLADAIAERMSADGLWAPSVGTDGIHIATVRALVSQASVRPAMATRAVFVVGDAERMVSQEGADQAANAFLKLLEEPPPGTTLILTTSEPGALLPTIRSRVVTMRVPPIGSGDMQAFLADSAVQRRFAKGVSADVVQRVSGAPGELLADSATAASMASARKLLDAALQPPTPAGTAERAKAAARQGVAGARGAFTDMLDALTILLHERARQLVTAGHDADARRTAIALLDVENAKLRAQGNVSPQLLGASLLASLHRTLRPQ
jgi:DNA polymerase-3 subunit delta'